MLTAVPAQTVLSKGSALGSAPSRLLLGHRTGCGWGTPKLEPQGGGVRVVLPGGGGAHVTHRGPAIAMALGAMGKESPLYGLLAGDRDPVVQGQKLLSLSLLQGFLQHWREAVLAPFGVQRNFLGARGARGVASKLPGVGRGGFGGHSKGRGGAGHPQSPTP